jgi:hypothetical protein
MGTETEHGQHHWFFMPSNVTLAPVSCRMISVQVIKSETGYTVSWNQVVALITAIGTHYWQRAEQRPQTGATHEEMLTRGWKVTPLGRWVPLVSPVLAGGNSSNDDGLRVEGELFHPVPNLEYSTVVPCFWPPEEDEVNAVSIAKELIASDGDISNRVEIENDNM